MYSSTPITYTKLQTESRYLKYGGSISGPLFTNGCTLNQSINTLMPPRVLLIDDEKFNKYLDLCDEEPLQSMTNRGQRTEFLHFEHGFTRWELLLLKETTPKIWRHMLDAHKNHRPAGVIGRPSLLTQEQEQTLVETILKADHDDIPLFMKSVTELVCSVFSVFIFFSRLHS